jgi:hypothetical protein
VALPSLPLTPNGKLDRKALPAPDASPSARGGYEAPMQGVEQTLAAIWAEALKLDRVSRHDHFFELGGHSLLAVGVIERMRQAGLVADAQRLFVAPTIATLAASLNEIAPAHEVPANAIPQPASLEDEADLRL